MKQAVLYLDPVCRLLLINPNYRIFKMFGIPYIAKGTKKKMEQLKKEMEAAKW